MGDEPFSKIVDHDIAKISDEELIQKAYKAHDNLVNFQDPFGNEIAVLKTDFPNISHQPSEEKLGQIRERLKDKSLVDLGGPYGLPQNIRGKLGIYKYTLVDLQKTLMDLEKNPYAKAVRADALEYIKALPDESTNVMSNGFLTTDIFGSALIAKEVAETKEYLQRLFRHIARVLPPHGIFIATHFDLENLAEANGLKKNEDLSDYYDSVDNLSGQQRTSIFVFEKATNQPEEHTHV
jgi:SAM-dependent methyltransferase